MIARCANPNCSAAFDHREGWLYRFPKRPADRTRLARAHFVQHVWLWAACCETYALEYDSELGVTLREFVAQASSPSPRQVIAARAKAPCRCCPR